jgi:hypothetical protein
MVEAVHQAVEMPHAQSPHWQALEYPYDVWMRSEGVKLYTGYAIPDLRTLELQDWDEQQCKAAFVQLEGAQGITEVRISEIPPGKTLPPVTFALDELVYVLDGRGLTTVWTSESGPKKTFEWQKHSLFMLPHGSTRQFSNAQGDRPARLLHYNYLPLAMTVIQDRGHFFGDRARDTAGSGDGMDSFYSEATIEEVPLRGGVSRSMWYGNFFPDMRAWDQLRSVGSRGAGGSGVQMRFPNSMTLAHMSQIPAYRYKKGHRHGPGRFIVIPVGEGYSIMWEEGKEKVVVPWHEASAFVPPNCWFHQHFNLGAQPARYLALHPPPQFSGHAEKVEDRARDQIEYPDEEPWIREMFESELAKRGLESQMPDDAYHDRDFEFGPSESDH